ncbi:MAG: hypothetical protein IPK10_09470 [Bacteroidetes bacterium]|nr:hypothetical protein [Bacteroidota bacterium]
MNKNKLLLGVCFILMSFVFIQCKDKKKEEEDNCPEGRTGQLTMVFKMLHHSRPIPGCRVFIKYSASEFPGTDTTKYDYAVTAENTSAYASIDSLNCGSYYVYAIGIDSLLDPTDWVCVGGLPFNNSMVAGVDSINVYITEGD